MTPADLDGRVAVVTGAGSGIGRATAIALAEAGAVVVCTDRDGDAARDTADKAGAAANGVHLDVTDLPAVRALVADVTARYGRLDVYANVAGAVTSRGPVATVTEDEFDRGVAVNLKSLVFGCQAAASAMARGGSIVNVGSGTVDAAVPGLAAYSIPKAGVPQLTRSLARELGPAGIRVNAVSPGYILTAMTGAHFRDADDARRVVEEQSAAIPLGRPGEAAEVASVVVFLAGDGASYITGQVIRVNGGSVMPL
ncbi:SDR family NAD(P)-dependent oxidoreductase [Amycolatopsis thermoflava]|uniref:SDR family NAD(P)-dependent oxidoreductase n=1 Tax=Amycolatopsis thermoflava TaxID=84480 RepID=UPI0003FA6011|nr:SDR family oxidoreductase [Amycolatopsis thermoflava]